MIRIPDFSINNHGPIGNQKPIDFVKLRDEQNVKAVVIRIAEGLLEDTWYKPDYDAAKAAGLTIIGYYAPYPNLSNTQQLAKVKEITAGRNPDQYMIDMEVSGGQNAVTITACLGYFITNLPAGTIKAKPLGYTNANYGNLYITNNFGIDWVIANPGSSGYYNNNSSPTLPNILTMDDCVMWQRSWKWDWGTAVPDNTCDMSEWLGTDEEFYAYYQTSPTPPPSQGCDLTPVLTDLAQIKASIAVLQTTADQILEKVSGTEPPPPTPQPDNTIYVVVNGDKAIAYQTDGKNAKGKWIFTFYPKGEAASKRIIWDNGQKILVEPTVIQGDSNARMFKVSKQEPKVIAANPPIDVYVSQGDVMKLV